MDKITEFNGYKIELKKLNLRTANTLFPLVIMGMTKLSIGNFNFFSDLKVSDMELFQEKLCEYSFKIQEDGTKKNLSIEDLDDHIEGILPLLFIFLEYNFGFFSQARKILDPILTKS